MALGGRICLFSFLLLSLLLRCARSDGSNCVTSEWNACIGGGLGPVFTDTSSQLLGGINKYRASLNLSLLTENKNADCLAEQIAQAFKGQDCSNSTGSDTVPGTEEQFPNFPNYLSSCHLDAMVTQDGSIMPACVPGLVPDLVLSNYTKSQYNQKLNSSSNVGVGIADEGDWVVVVLTTDTPTGNFAPAADATTDSSGSISYHRSLMMMLLGFSMFLIF